MAEIPSGTITFMFTDLEDSTKLWENHPATMQSALARHDEIFSHAIRDHAGEIVKTTGDGFHAAFDSPANALTAAIAAQTTLAAETWDRIEALRVRIGIHTGEAVYRSGDYYGTTLNRAARLMSIGHGGQVLLSAATYQLVVDTVGPEMRIKDLGLHALKGLQRDEHVYQVSLPGLPDEFPPLRSVADRPHNLPLQMTPFFGRERELERLQDLLQRPAVRVVTLLGPGGTGKTRLSIELAGSLLETFADGVFFIPLAAISDPDLVPSAIAQTIGVREGGGLPPIDNLKAYLKEKQILFVLDNLEQVIDCAAQVAGLLQAAPGLKIAATSRVPLRISGEQEFPVSPLPVPVGPGGPDDLLGFESVRLFVSAVQAADPEFVVTAENAAVIADICRRLDGLPLALEIAAARSKLLPLPEILKRVKESLKVLSRRDRDLPARQQTLQAAIDWSYDLLEPEDRIVFARLGAFVGSFTLTAAEKICDPDGNIDILDSIEVLLDNSLVRRSAQEVEETRFEMLLTIRDFALEKLAESGELDQTRGVHANFFARTSEMLMYRLFSTGATAALYDLELDYGNYRAALDWGLEAPGRLAVSAQIINNINWFWFRHGRFQEGRAWSEKVLAKTTTGDISVVRGFALTTSALMAMWEADLHTALGYMEEGLEIFQFLEITEGIANASLGAGVVLINQGRDAEAQTHLENVVRLMDEIQFPYFKAIAMVHLANAALGLGKSEEARGWLDQAESIAAQEGDSWLKAFATNNKGEVARVEGDYGRAQAYYEETERLFQDADARGDQARLVHTYGYLEQHAGNLDRAERLFRESLDQFIALGNKRGIAECMAGLAGVAARRGEPGWAAPLLAAAGRLLTSFGAAWWPADRVEFDRNMALLAEKIDDPKQLQTLLDQGSSFSLERALAYAQAGPEQA
ncbi:MAG TPA: adenylate/guanylate cyclase domain-containing protein [Anaerolineales bacterium]|nr:adenylate/guanylate cyclase domain-containing protein [Anaerolineales bacterium]